MPVNSAYRQRLKQRVANAPKAASEELWLYREAAAVLASFDYESLSALGGGSTPSSDAKSELLADCDVVYTPGGARNWSLCTPVRRASLRRLLAEGKVVEALNANPERPDTAVQHVLERLLLDETPRVASFESPEEGRALLEVIDWLSGIPELERRLPSVEGVKQHLAYEQLLQPFRDLVGTHFAGRKPELNQLADYVGVQESHGFLEAASRAYEYVLSIHDRPPLFINGPGGCGKSTLIAKFILDHAEVDEFERFPFAYLDFDRAGLVAKEPITLLAEVMRQLAVQFPHTSDRYRRISDEWSERFSEHLIKSELTSLAPDTRRRIRVEDREVFLSQFADFINHMKTKEQPLLLVLDTFEEVQFRSAAFADEVLDFLNDLQARVPRLRTVLSGRAEIHSSRYRVRRVAIGNFDREAGVAYLAARGLPDSRVAERIYDQVGGSPLVLRLAADLAISEKVGEGGIDSLNAGGWLARFRKESVEVVLYKRILSHVYDKRVEELAYPGLVLRVITPEVLREVLAPACGVELASDEDARNMVRVMREQLSTLLIPSGDDETLTHRPDMRSILIEDMIGKSRKDKAVAEKLKRIHEKAVEYYVRYDDPARRAEEIYHRLALGIDREALASRWMEGLTPYLGSSIRELPPPSQVYLAARLGLELPAELWAEAEDEDWILYASRLADQNLELEKPFDAVEVLQERKGLWTAESLRPVLDRVARAVLHHDARRYEQLRKSSAPSYKRTELMNSLFRDIVGSSHTLLVDGSHARDLFAEGRPGTRIAALAVAEARPYPEAMDMAIAAIKNAVSPFEQYHALRLASLMFNDSTESQRAALRESLLLQEGIPIHDTDTSRTSIKKELLKKLPESGMA
jgi:hypothetical protein